MNIEQAKVVLHEEFGGGYRYLVFEAPAVASAVRPGQFVHVKIPDLEASVLRRPFSVFASAGTRVSILFKPVGKGTNAMLRLAAGDEANVIGPLGNGFPLDHEGTYPVLVAGGYGVAPLYFLATRLPVCGMLFVGGATAKDVLCVDEFKKLGWQVRVATEDGSWGATGRVTAALDPWLEGRSLEHESERDASRQGSPPTSASEGVPRLPDLEFYACGPDGMLQAIGERAVRGGWQAWLSLDKHMGCGVGACLACVQRIRRDGVESWMRVCTDGPIFEAREIVW